MAGKACTGRNVKGNRGLGKGGKSSSSKPAKPLAMPSKGNPNGGSMGNMNVSKGPSGRKTRGGY